MTVPTFPFQYKRPPDGGPQGMGTMLTWEQLLQQETFYRLHPEVQRRYGALMHDGYAVGVALGVGTGWRVQPNPPPAGFAQPGNSWHESCPVSPVSATAVAIDTVPNVSWDWMHGQCGKYGLRHFKYVGSEPWHVQPSEFPTSRSFRTVLPPLAVWTLPSEPPPVTPPPVTPPPTTGGTFTLDLQKNELTPAKREQLRGNGDVYLIQQIAMGHWRQFKDSDPSRAAKYDCGKPDGDYGPRSQDAVRQMQRDGGLTVDAQCGQQTWSYVLNKSGG